MNGQRGSRDSIIKLFFSSKKNNNENKDEKKDNKKDNKKEQQIYTINSKDNVKKTANENETNIVKNEKESISIESETFIKETNNSVTNETEIVITKSPTIDEISIPESEIIIEKETDYIVSKENIEKNKGLKETNDKYNTPKEDDIEKLLIDKLQTMIINDLEELEEIKYELSVIDKENDEEVELKKVEVLQRELIALNNKFKKIKEKYNFKNEYEFEIDEEILIENLLIDYKDELSDNVIYKKIESKISEIEEYVSVIEQLIIIENDEESLNKDIDDKLNKFEIRDEEFEKLKEKYNNSLDTDLFIEKFNNKQDHIIKELEEKVDKSVEIQTKIEKDTSYILHYNKLIEAALIASLTKKIPRTFSGNIIRTALIIQSASLASQFVQKKEFDKKVTTVKYTDYSKDIKNGIDITKKMIYQIDDSLQDVKEMKKKFKDEFREFSNDFSEYKSLEKKLDELEYQLISRKKTSQKYTQKFEKVLNYNEQKIKKAQELKTA